MKLAFALFCASVCLALNTTAAPDSTYDLSTGDVCVLQIIKETSPSFVIACAEKTKVNNPIQAYSQMLNAAVFQAEAKKIFLSRLIPTTGFQCTEYDNATSYLLICKNP